MGGPSPGRQKGAVHRTFLPLRMASVVDRQATSRRVVLTQCAAEVKDEDFDKNLLRYPLEWDAHEVCRVGVMDGRYDP
jgi:hypothetical protein